MATGPKMYTATGNVRAKALLNWPRLVYIEEGQLFCSAHPEVRQQFEVQRLIERIWYVPVSLVTCVMAALSLVLSVARRVARNVLF